MSGNQEDPGPSAKGASTSPRGPSSKVISQDSSLQEARIQPKPVSGSYSPQSSSSSLESNLAPGNYTPRKSSASDPVKSYSTRENYLNYGKQPAQVKYPSRRTGKSPGGYRGEDNVSLGGYSNERGLSRAGYNTYNPRSYHSPPPDDRRSSGYSYDNDSEENSFSEKSIRQAFVRKVYVLILCMMLFATALISFMMLHTPTQMFIRDHKWLVIVSWVAYPVLIMILVCCETVRRTFPCNYVILFLVTLTLSFTAGCSAAHYNKYTVLAAFGITAVLCLGLTLFACQTKWDFTVISGGLVIASIVMLILGLVLIFWRNKIAMIGYACLGAILGCFFFIFDTQMIIGGKHKYAINPEEYVFAAITLFTDMINIFIMMTNIIGLSRS